ncbi:TadA family conjugal transfer-associated ATPase [Corynebacterium cystitidis]|uniref:TadA family conjugal transfer-associated ATPase n=1 Tax=Corynebacterium cystitidis TaxID=35757 RepID=UPI00211EB4C1|nr:TadA family conjugal transfer-associated ATPase [Corynebacterium cystitidis]
MTVTPEVLERIQRRLADDADSASLTTDAAELARIIREEAMVISDVDVLETMRMVRNSTHGLGPLEALVARPQVTDICVNGPDQVFVDSGGGLEVADVCFANDDEVRRLATRLATACGRRLDDAQPFLDGHITRPDGTLVRIHAVLAPPASQGTCISLRVLRHSATTLANLVNRGTLPAQVADVLRGIVRRHASFLVVGGTGSGKTTLLGALLAEVPAHERIIALEDTVELAPDHPHVVNLTTRGANTEGSGAITMSDLLKQSLRMRPDRIVVGEIRGGEVVDLLAALNTGHEGGAGTIHANSLAEVPARIEALGALGGLEPTALHSQLAAAVKVVLVMKRGTDGVRALHQIGLLHGNPVVASACWSAEGGPGEGFDELCRIAGVSTT